MDSNGLRSFAFHAQQRRPIAAALDGSVALEAVGPTIDADPESIARMYVQQALASPDVPEFTAAEVRGRKPVFKLIGVEKLPLTGTQTVKFRQCYRGIPVYGSLVTVELDERQQLLALNSALAEPDIDAVAAVSVKQAVEIISKAAGYPPGHPLDIVPQLNYYFAPADRKWYLVYVAEDVPKYHPPESPRQMHDLPEVFDYVVCAHTGIVVGELPRTMTAEPTNAPAPASPAVVVPDFPAGWEPVEYEVADELGRQRKIQVMRKGTMIRFYDPTLKVYTHDFRFHDIDLQKPKLPGEYIDAEPPPPQNPWIEGAVCAHANVADVARFFKNVLLRNGLDNLGGVYVSSIQCCSVFNGGNAQEWHNAAWIGSQMVYGQRKVQNGTTVGWRSFARAADVVAHEITHGLTERTARLQYKDETGALNESYSDIFGMLVTQFGKPDRNEAGGQPAGPNQWDWELGKETTPNGVPVRNLADPARGNPPQPTHMDQYLFTSQDHGGVHINSGIHNKAFFNLAVTRVVPGGEYLFADKDLAALFYLTLTQHLSRTSGFADSRRAVGLVTRTLFRNDPDERRDQKIAAVAEAFETVGIKDQSV